MQATWKGVWPLSSLFIITLAAWTDGALGSISTTPAWTYNINQDLAKLGWDLETAGDVNGDGFSDVIVSAPGFSNGQSSEGKVYLFYGGPNDLSSSPAWQREGGQTLASLGEDCAPAGDVNGDGYDDVIVGAPKYTNGQNFEGQAYVFYGSASGLPASPSWTVDGNGASYWMGGKVAPAGDVNADGYADVLIAATNYGTAPISEGKVHLYLGGPSGLATSPAWTREANQESSRYGSALSTAGDVNGDGYDDVIIGTPFWDQVNSNEGMAQLFLGNATGLATVPLWTIYGGLTQYAFAVSVACAGDVNGDGYSDIAINGGNFPSHVWIYHGGPSGPDNVPDRQYDADTNTLGIGLFTAGDVNGDGYADLIIGDESADSGNPGNGDEGAAYLYLGSPSGLGTSPVSTVWGEELDSGTYARCCTTAGDVNGDGFADVLVGDWAFDDDNAGSEGKCYLYLGGPSKEEGTRDWADESNQADADYGISCASGDWNNDGFSDLAVGSWYQDSGQTNEGVCFVYLGSRTGISVNSSWSADGDQDGANFGYAVETAGDVNGDGYEDLIVGAPVYDNGESNEGRVFVYLGGSGGLANVPSWSAEGNEANAWFGWSVSGAGDVNGDGFADVVVGVPNWDGGGAVDQGKAQLYLGSAAGLATTPAWTYIGSETDAGMGYSVSGAGDVNGDGYFDVIVGLPGRSNGQSREGIAYVFLGNASGLANTPVAILQENQANSNFGISVSDAGDVNGDGRGDVIVGASNWSNGNTTEGAAFVYHGTATGVNTVHAWSVEGAQDGAHRGEDVAGAGDVNNDGYSEVVVGSPYYTTTLTDEGRASVWFGGPSGLAASTTYVINGGQDNSRFGASVTSAGDINGDGFGDLAVGQPDYANGQNSEGRAVLYFGNEQGLDRAVRQLRNNGSTPVAVHGMNDSPNDVRLAGYARTAMGRGRVQAQYVFAQAGDLFGSSAPNDENLWRDTGAPTSVGSRVYAVTSPLATLEEETAWHWRLRWRSDSPYFPWTPWLAPARGSKTETDFRTPQNTSDAPLVDGLPALRFARIWPNPATDLVSLSYVLPRDSNLRLTIHDVQGREVARLVDGRGAAGNHTADWKAGASTQVAAGVYFARLEAEGTVRTKKIVIAR